VAVVDDDDNFVELMTLVLGSEGYEVVGWGKDSEPVSFIERERPDVVLLDLWMPQADGLQVLNQVKSRAETAAIPVLVVTATDVPMRKGPALDQADGVLAKPFDVDELLGVVALATGQDPPLGERCHGSSPV
jgi:DNA-binding response OmpR family regulator